MALALLRKGLLPARLLPELRGLPASLLGELRIHLLGDELLQVHRDLLGGRGNHLRQDDLLRDRQELAHQRLDDLLDRELSGELLLARELPLHGRLLG